MNNDYENNAKDNLDATMGGISAAYAYYKSMEPFWGVWRIDKLIGEGAFGKVFRIVRNDFGKEYKSALKIITVPPSESEWRSVMADGLDEVSATSYFYGFVNEIVNETALMSELRGNSNIVSYEDHMVIEHTDHHGWDILIKMELLTPFLETITPGNSLDRKQVINLGIDLCKALELCHKNNLIHRDIKPENIFVSPAGDYKLGDFGVARTVEKTTGAMSQKGTPTYMAPEVYYGREYGASVDLYSLGIVMYKCLNRHRTPFLPLPPSTPSHQDKEDALKRRLGGEIIQLPIDAADDLGRIILKACAYKPEDRYQSATEMRLELERLNGNRSNSEKDSYGDPTISVYHQPNTNREIIETKTVEQPNNEEETPKELVGEETHTSKTVTLNRVVEKDKKKIIILMAVICLLAGGGLVLLLLNGKKGTDEIITDGTDLHSSMLEPVTSEVIETQPTEISEEENLWDSLFVNLKKGDTVDFGSYEQDGNIENGKEPIEWTVLERTGDDILLISNYILDSHVYDEKNTDVTWEKSSLRSWLNGDFYSAAFSSNERNFIQSVNISNLDNTFYETEGGDDTEDKVFCLNVEEIMKYYDFNNWNDNDQYGYCQALITAVTQYAKDNGAPVYTITKEDYDSKLASEGYDSSCINQECGWWWLRSPGIDSSTASDVSNYGSAGWGARYIETGAPHGVRPALYIGRSKEVVNLDSAKVGDTVCFGSYEQDADDKDGIENIYWTVLDEKDDRVLLISNKILDYKQYNDTEDKVTWEDSSVRKWLNDGFYMNAFSDEEKSRIIEMELDNPSSYDFYQTSYMSERWDWWEDGDFKGSTGGADTMDKVFLLSYEEALKYYTDEDRMAGATASTVEKGIYVMRLDDYEKDYSGVYNENSVGKAVWWLRSPGWDAEHIMRVDYDGRLNVARITGDWFGIRPAIWIRKE